MTSPSVKASEELQKPPVAKMCRSKWIADHDDTPSLSASCREVARQFTKIVQNKKSLIE